MLHQNKPQQIRGSHVPRCWITPFCQMPHLCLSFGRTGHQEINQPSLKTYRTQEVPDYRFINQRLQFTKVTPIRPLR